MIDPIEYIKHIDELLITELRLKKSILDIPFSVEQFVKYEDHWIENSVPFHHGVVCCLLSKVDTHIFRKELDFKQWVIDLYQYTIREALRRIDEELNCYSKKDISEDSFALLFKDNIIYIVTKVDKEWSFCDQDGCVIKTSRFCNGLSNKFLKYGSI